VRRLPFFVLLAAVIAAPVGACHRRRPRDGTCAAHIDCDRGYDCVARRCTKRGAAPGIAGAAPAAPDEAPAPAGIDEPAGEGTPPAVERPRPKLAPAPPMDNAPAPPPSDLPAWKARLKNNI
jgi:hypothetical protein